MKLVKNHWGWSPRGIRLWMGWWAWPIAIWGVQVTPSPNGRRRFDRRVKIGPVCFRFGQYEDRDG